jgi:multiple sugar transport system substrate-binding protein
MKRSRVLVLTVSLALAALAAGVLLIGCERGGKRAGAPVQLTFWQFWRTEWIRPLLDRFEAEHPGIRVELQQLTWQSGLEKIEASVAAGTAPDLCELGSTWLPRFAGSGVLADLTAVAEPITAEYLQWEAARHEGRIYGLPWVVGTRALFLNQALFRQAGLDPSRPPVTWEDLIQAAARIDALGTDIHGYGLNAGERYVLFKKFMPFAWGNGGEILTPDFKRSLFDSPANVEALVFYQRLSQVSLIEKQDVIDRSFMDGRVGMMISGAWNLRTIPEGAPELDFDVAMVPRPAVDRGRHASFAGGEFLVSFARSPHQAEALELARFLIRRENAVALCRAARSVQPAARGAEEDPYYRDHPKDRLFVTQLQTAVAPPAHPQWVEIEEILDGAIEETLYRRRTAAEAVHAASERIDKLLADEAAREARADP